MCSTDHVIARVVVTVPDVQLKATGTVAALLGIALPVASDRRA